ncbi:MAG: hypothetical protein BWY83_00645 [bacterium ADurb.Bin478]|nr:MAG: hypothetical protein BWY83_00645 [bacterium ADurb.Bin478]
MKERLLSFGLSLVAADGARAPQLQPFFCLRRVHLAVEVQEHILCDAGVDQVGGVIDACRGHVGIGRVVHDPDQAAQRLRPVLCVTGQPGQFELEPVGVPAAGKAAEHIQRGLAGIGPIVEPAVRAGQEKPGAGRLGIRFVLVGQLFKQQDGLFEALQLIQLDAALEKAARRGRGCACE